MHSNKSPDWGHTTTFNSSECYKDDIIVTGNRFQNIKDFKPYARPMVAGDIGVKEVTQLRVNL